MENRFKFRGYSNGYWYEGAYLKHLPYTPYCCGPRPKEEEYKHIIIYDGFSDWGLPRDITYEEVNPNSVGQCTGLRDKNGKLIYEGDIVKTGEHNLCHADDTYKVIWHKEYAQFLFKSVKTGTCIDFMDAYQVTIIGNTFENPELLTEENK